MSNFEELDVPIFFSSLSSLVLLSRRTVNIYYLECCTEVVRSIKSFSPKVRKELWSLLFLVRDWWSVTEGRTTGHDVPLARKGRMDFCREWMSILTLHYTTHNMSSINLVSKNNSVKLSFCRC